MAGQVGSKKTRRQAAKEYRRAAAAARARARRRSQIMLAVLAALAVAGIIVAVTLLVRTGGGDGTDSLAPAATPSAASPPAAAFPALPAGVDPALGTKPIVQAGSGDVTTLKATTLIEGTGPAAQNGSNLEVNYVGVTYKDGQEFDASWKLQQTLPVTLGTGGVIKGWDQGLLGIKQGSRVQLDIPADLAYGEQAPAGYPSGDLRFVIDVLSVK